MSFTDGHGIPDKTTVAGHFIEIEKGKSLQKIHLNSTNRRCRENCSKTSFREPGGKS